jgi:hypothetical protein
MDTPAPCWSFLLSARGSRTYAIGGLGRGQSALRRPSGSSFTTITDQGLHTLAIMISISVVNQLMTFGGHHLRTRPPAGVKDSP